MRLNIMRVEYVSNHRVHIYAKIEGHRFDCIILSLDSPRGNRVVFPREPHYGYAGWERRAWIKIHVKKYLETVASTGIVPSPGEIDLS